MTGVKRDATADARAVKTPEALSPPFYPANLTSCLFPTSYTLPSYPYCLMLAQAGTCALSYPLTDHASLAETSHD